MAIDTIGIENVIWTQDPEAFSKKYKHLGTSYPGVPKGWKQLTMECLQEIEEEMWPQWMPYWLKRFIHYQATGNSVVKVKSNFWYKIRSYFTNGMIVFDVKDKYSTLRIYGTFNDKIHTIIERYEEEAEKTCEVCGSQENVELQQGLWLIRYCKQCLRQK